MGSSEQLPEPLKTKIIHVHKAGEGYKKIAQRFKVPVSSVRNVIKKWQSTGTVDVKLRSGRPSKISDVNARRIASKVTENPRLTARDLQEELAHSGVVVHCSTVQRHLRKLNVRAGQRDTSPASAPQNSAPQVCERT